MKSNYKSDLATDMQICDSKAKAMKDVAMDSRKWKSYAKKKRKRVRSGMIADQIVNRVRIPW